MGRTKRMDAAGYAYHVLNRGNGRMTIFEEDADYEAFERVMQEAVERFPSVGVIAYCLMPNHWHMVLHPQADGQLSRFVGWLTLTHTQRWHAHRNSTGGGHVYQGRFKSFPVETDQHLVTVCRYVERNPVAGKLVSQAEDWPWSSLHRWVSGDPQARELLSPWPTPNGRRPPKWLDMVNTPVSEAEQTQLSEAISRNRPMGSVAWQDKVIAQYDLGMTARPRGRPRKT